MDAELKNYDLSGIHNNVIEPRNSISHWLTRRSTILTLAKFEGYYTSVMETIEIVRLLLGRLPNSVLIKYPTWLQDPN